MIKQNGLAPILIIILIALAVGGYLSIQKQIKTIPQPIIQSSPSPITSEEIANWKTYISPEYNPFYTEEQLKAEIERIKSNGEDPDQDPTLQNVRFSIKLPNGWEAKYDQKGLNGESDTFGSGFTFTAKNLEIRVGKFYAPGGNSCAKDFAGYGNNYKDIKTNFMTLRRVKEFVNTSYIPKGYIRFELCAGEGQFLSENSPLGLITYTLPDGYNPADLDLMDKVISTLQKI